MPSVPAVKRALGVLELLVHEDEPLSLSAIAQRTEIPVASCHAIMHTLLEEGYVVRRSEGRAQYWEPTLALYHLGATLVSRFGIRPVALPHLRELAADLGVPAHLGVLVGRDVMYLEKAAAPSFVQFDTFAGKRSPFHHTALGRAIVAFLPEQERELLLPGSGEGAELARVLADVRRDGYAREDGEEAAGIGCVAAPIFGADGAVIASAGITGFSRELFPGDAVPAAAAVTRAAAAISADLGHPAPTPAAAG